MPFFVARCFSVAYPSKTTKAKKKGKKKGVGGDGRRYITVTNLREAPYSLKDGDVVGVVDRDEDPQGVADLNRADDHVSILFLGGGVVALSHYSEVRDYERTALRLLRQLSSGQL